MNKQPNMSFLSDELKEAKTQKKEFFEQINRIMPWGDFTELVEPYFLYILNRDFEANAHSVTLPLNDTYRVYPARAEDGRQEEPKEEQAIQVCLAPGCASLFRIQPVQSLYTGIHDKEINEKHNKYLLLKGGNSSKCKNEVQIPCRGKAISSV